MRALNLFLLFFFLFALNSYSLPKCEEVDPTKWNNCVGTWIERGGKFEGEYKDGSPHGKGTWTHPDGDKYIGEYKDGVQHGKGTYIYPSGNKYVGIWKDDKEWNGNGYNTRNQIIVRFVNGVRINQ